MCTAICLFKDIEISQVRVDLWWGGSTWHRLRKIVFWSDTISVRNHLNYPCPFPSIQRGRNGLCCSLSALVALRMWTDEIPSGRMPVSGLGCTLLVEIIRHPKSLKHTHNVRHSSFSGRKTSAQTSGVCDMLSSGQLFKHVIDKMNGELICQS